MDARIKAEWTDLLRSGNFNQGSQKLHTSTRNEDGTERHEFCCLGVLCELAVEAGIVDRVELSPADGYEGPDVTYAYVPKVDPTDRTAVHYPPQEVAEWAGLRDTNPYVNTTPEDFPSGDREYLRAQRQVIANANDDGAPFTKIADIIDDQL